MYVSFVLQHSSSAVILLRSENCAVLVITQRVVVISYRRFGETYLSRLQGSRIENTFGFLTPEDGTEITLVRSVRPVIYCGLDFPLLSVCKFGVSVR